VVVIGGGILGLATAHRLLARHPGLELTLLEKEASVGTGQTGHNSGVIHRGVYYAPGSLKATLCARGAQLLTRFCDEHGIAYELCGKLIVAVDEAELPRLEELHRRATANGVPGIQMVDGPRISEIEPAVRGLRALHSPQTGIVNFGHVAAALAERVTQAGGEIRLRTRVRTVRRDGATSVVETTRGQLRADGVVACAGLQADRVTRTTRRPRSDVRIVPFRGDYFALAPQAAQRIRGMVYPVPDPSFPFLGVHLTRQMGGSVLAGPNAVLALARERYGRLDVMPRDAWESLAFPGFWRLALRYWRVGAAEVWRDVSKRAYAAAVARYMPSLKVEDLLPGPAGIRAQALGRDGRLIDDFALEVAPGLVNVLNAPSPAATSSLAIADEIVDRVQDAFDLPAAPSTT
jgi:L-2-hydroxyglutarate oxidase LhgO